MLPSVLKMCTVTFCSLASHRIVHLNFFFYFCEPVVCRKLIFTLPCSKEKTEKLNQGKISTKSQIYQNHVDLTLGLLISQGPFKFAAILAFNITNDLVVLTVRPSV